VSGSLQAGWATPQPSGQPTGAERYGWDLLGVMDIDTPEVKFLDRRGITSGEGVLQGHVR